MIQQVNKCMCSVTVLAFCQNFTFNLGNCSNHGKQGSLEIPYSVETNVGHHVNCLLLMSNFNTNWTVLTDFRKTP
jgi:hypothetical protein